MPCLHRRDAIKTRQKNTSRNGKADDDRVTRYARAVVAKKIIAGPHVRAACQRHIDDLRRTDIYWDIAAAENVIGFFADVLRLNGGEWEGKPYHLLDWQAFVVGCLFGWKQLDGTRRFRVAYIEAGKGSGKSPMVAGCGIYGLTADGESRAEIYSAGTKMDQARILFRDAVAMVDQSPELRKRITKSGVGENTWNMAYRDSGSWFRAISADQGQSGPRPHMSLIDEIHEHKTAYVVEMLKAGQKSRRQPLTIMITNSGTDRHSVCWEYHDYCAKVSDGSIDDDSFFGYICALDEGDDPMTDESCWIKANPSIDAGIPTMKYLRDQVKQARSMPGKESVVRRLNFCQWVESASPWISREAWTGAEDGRFNSALLMGRKCWGGLDLSSTTDLTALVLLFEPTPVDPMWRLLPTFWLPGDSLREREDKDRVPYLRWHNEGHLEAAHGKTVNRLAIAIRCAEITSSYDLQALAYDRWRIKDFKQVCDDEGISLPFVDFGQGYKSMAPAVDEFERMLVGGTLRHNGNPIMTWCAANAVIETDPAGNRKITKEKATGRVDGIVAAVMAAGISMNKESVGVSSMKVMVV